MSAKKKRFKPYDCMKNGESNLSATLYVSMLESPAYKDLSSSAIRLYNYMVLQLYGQQAIDGDELTFFFNRGLYMRYELYKNWSQFARDRKQLIEHGFIEEIENGHNTRTKNKYRFSDKWKNWKPK